MLVHLLFLFIFFTGSADSSTAAPMSTMMPTQTPSDDLDPFAGEGKQACSYHSVVEHLDMRADNRLYTATRPVLNHTHPTVVRLLVALTAILDVVEKDLKLVSSMWIRTEWDNEHISWDPSKFCGIEWISVPNEWLWKPDIIIEERLEKDKVVLSPYVFISSDGTVIALNKEVVVSMCRMNIYKFPFDSQSCNLTFSSGIYYSNDLELKTYVGNTYLGNEDIRLITTMMIREEYDWMFEDFKYMEINETDLRPQQIVYTVTMKRKAVLYIVNFLLPVLFFLLLDIASFLISDGGGEKLSFKVTVLLAVTVLQLILNEILPATSNTMPIIAMYCCGSFALMLLSLLETILVVYLLEKDSVPQKTETDKDHNLKEDEARGHSSDRERTCKWCPCFYNVPGGDTHELQSAAEEHTYIPKEESHGFRVILDELRHLEKNVHTVLFKSKEGGGRAGYWSRMAMKINKAFFIAYVTTVVVFLIVIYNHWNPEY